MANQGEQATAKNHDRFRGIGDGTKSQFVQFSINVDKITNQTNNNNNNNCQSEFLKIKDVPIMRELSLRSKQLTNLPQHFANHLTNITILDLSKNKLKDLPYSITFLSKLQHLLLDDNCIESLPVIVTEIHNLKVLQLSNNSIVKLPENFGHLRSLERLVLSSNKLIELPDSCKQMDKLKYLDISGNLLKSIPECIIMGMKNLETLNFSYNKFINSISRPASNKLKYFYIRETGIRLKFPIWILTGLAPNLEVLILDGTRFKNFDFPDKCTNLKIKHLSLQRCDFYDPFVKKLTNLTHSLETLRAGNGYMGNGGNAFWSMPIENLANPKLVTEIDVRSTGLCSIFRSIEDFENLVNLDVGGNNISWLPDEICRLEKLEILIADKNELSSLPHNIGLMSSLRELRVNNNHLAQLPETFREFKNLNYVDFYENEFHDVPKVLETMKFLVGLDLDQNFIEIADLWIGKVGYQVLREKLRGRYHRLGSYHREKGPRYERDIEEQSNPSSDKSSIACDEFIENLDDSTNENWDISDDSADEFDPTRDDNPHSTKKPLPLYDYAEMIATTFQFCPADLHPLPFKKQVQRMRKQGLIKECPAIVEGQFDDADDDNSRSPWA